MGGLRNTALALCLCLVGVGPLGAGVYNTAEPDWPPCDSFEAFRGQRLIPLRQIGSDIVQSTAHKRYNLVAALAVRGGPGNMTTEEVLNLSAYLIRLRKYKEAINVAEAGLRQDRASKAKGEVSLAFLLYANLATAQYLEGVTTNSPDFVRRAIDNLEGGTLAQWPRDGAIMAKKDPGRIVWLRKIGWREADYAHYRTAEEYFLKLLRLRARELPLAPKRANPLGEDVEGLFAARGKPPQPVRFVGDNNRYEAGKQDKAEADKLPPNAVGIVQQLLVWLPHDDRLYWLLGELLNARGEYLTALDIFEEISLKLQTMRLRGELQPLNPAHPDLPEIHRQHLFVLRAAKEAPAQRAAEGVPKEEPQPIAGPKRVVPATADVVPIDVRSLGVGFGVGLLVAIFGYWQWREIRRRVQARSAARMAHPVQPWHKPEEAITVKREGGGPG